MNLKVGGPPQNVPTVPGKVSQQQNKTISGAAAELNAARMIALAEGGRTASAGAAGLTSAAGGLQSAFSLTQGGAAAQGGGVIGFSQTAFALGVLGVEKRSEGGALGQLLGGTITAQDNHALNNTEAGKALLALSGRQQENALGTLQQLSVAAQAGEQALKQHAEYAAAVKLGKKSSNQTAGAGAEEGVQEMNGEDGKVYDNFVTLADQKSEEFGVNLRGMPIEDAVMLMFMLISEDARKDTRDLLKEMDEVRIKRGALRKAEQLMKEEKTKLEKEARESWNALPEPKDKFEDWLSNQNIEMPVIQTDFATGEASIVQSGKLLPPPPPPPETEGAGGAGAAEGTGDGGETTTEGEGATTEGGGGATGGAGGAEDGTIANPADAEEAQEQRAEVAQAQEGSPGQSQDGGQGEVIGGGTGSFAQFGNSIDAMRDKRDSLSELSETQQLKMQIYTDRMAKADSANSNLMKKMSDTLNSIIQNMK